MRIITRKKPAFTDLYQTGVLTRIAAVKTDSGGWRLFGVWRDQDIAVFVEAARGGIREWSGLNYLAEFVFSCGISLLGGSQQDGPENSGMKCCVITRCGGFFA